MVIVENISLVISTGIVSFPDTHGVVSEVDIAVVAWIVSMKIRLVESFLGEFYRRVLRKSVVARSYAQSEHLYLGILSFPGAKHNFVA